MAASESRLSIPQLDLRRFDSTARVRADFLGELRAAAHDVGFFYLDGHGIDIELLRALIDVSRRFFALPDADKRAIEMVNSPHFRGYTRMARELTRGVADWREQIDFGAERPALHVTPDQPAWQRLQGPNQWPTGSERISVAFFLGARLDSTVPLLRLPAELGARARGPEQDPNNPLFREVGQNYLKGRLRSHPDVARSHYPDLIGGKPRALR